MPDKYDTSQPELDAAYRLPSQDMYPHATDGFSERLKQELEAIGALGIQSSAERPVIE